MFLADLAWLEVTGVASFWSRGYGYGGVLVVIGHFWQLADLVFFRILEDTERVDPDVLKPELSGNGNGILERLRAGRSECKKPLDPSSRVSTVVANV